MKNFDKIFGLALLVALIFCVIIFSIESSQKEKHIDLPEEWEAVKQGDTLKVYRMNQDTIFVGFFNKENQKDRIY